MDPNKDRNDPMVQEYWLLGDDAQDVIRAAGYDAETVEGIAVDIHDVLQAADRIREEFTPAILNAADPMALQAALVALREEFSHIAWHCEAAVGFLNQAEQAIAKAPLA